MGSIPSKEDKSKPETNEVLKYPSTGHLDTNMMGSDRVRIQRGKKLESGLGPRRLSADLSLKSVWRWTRAAQAIDNLNPQSGFAIEAQGENGIEVTPCKGLRTKDTSLPEHWFEINGSKVYTMLRMAFGRLDEGFGFFAGVLLSLVYGGVHLTAWNYPFASKPEQLMWRISGISVMAQYPLYWTTFCCMWSETLMFFMASGITILFIFARVYLVTESFISLRHAPLGVYAAVPWVQSIPHV